MSYHHEIEPQDAHIIHNWVYETIADRDLHLPSEGVTDPITLDDVTRHRICYVKSERRFYFLRSLGPPLAWEMLGGGSPIAHASTHENGGIDEIDLTGMSGVLVDPQTPVFHAASHQSGGGDEIDVSGLSGVLSEDQIPQLHELNGDRHSGTLPESSIGFNDSGHDHTGGTKGTHLPLSAIVDVPLGGFVDLEQLSYGDDVNKVIGPLNAPPSPGKVALFPIGGPVQALVVDYTIRQVIGGSAPGWYICVDPLSSAPSGGSFNGGTNPSIGIADILALDDDIQVIYSTYPPP